jgi:hypothetical protein
MGGVHGPDTSLMSHVLAAKSEKRGGLGVRVLALMLMLGVLT